MLRCAAVRCTRSASSATHVRAQRSIAHRRHFGTEAEKPTAPSSSKPKATAPPAKNTPAKAAAAAAKAGPGEGAPFRYPIAWQDPDFYDEKKLEEESRRIFEVCHGCRRCFNLCNSFPRLFDLIDKTPGGALEEVPSKQFKSVADDCTMCDMCFITKCPYTPPHEFNIDFPALMLRYRAVERGAPSNIKSNPLKDAPQKLPPFKYTPEPVAVNVDRSLDLHAASADGVPRLLRDVWTYTDLVGPMASLTARLANWVTKRGPDRLPRQMLQTVFGISAKADLPQYVPRHDTLPIQAEEIDELNDINEQGPSFGKRKAYLFGTCFVTYNKPDIGVDAMSVLQKNGVEVETSHLRCCGMPQLEAGNIESVVRTARDVAPMLAEMIDEGVDIVSPIPSCTFMLKHEWPLLLPDNAAVKKVAARTFDLSEYIVDISKKEGLVKPLAPLDESITLQHACHARAQNMGFKSKEMLSLIPGLQVNAIERCSGHGGSFGVRKGTHEIAVNVGKPVAQTVLRDHKRARGEEAAPAAGAGAGPKKPIVKTFGGHPVGKHAAPHAAAPVSAAASPAESAKLHGPTIPVTEVPKPAPAAAAAAPAAATPAAPAAKAAPARPVRPHSVSSDCPLAADHLAQVVRDTASVEIPTVHPIQYLARSMKVGSTFIDKNER